MASYNAQPHTTLEDEFASLLAADALTYLREQSGITAYAKGTLSASQGVKPWFPSTLTFNAVIYSMSRTFWGRYAPKKIAEISMRWSPKGNRTSCRSYDKSAMPQKQLEDMLDKMVADAMAQETALDGARQGSMLEFLQSDRAAELRGMIAQASGPCRYRITGRSYPSVSAGSCAQKATS